jgi:aspartyl-tRNA(Asn)/glutamyl-tRNA(Gln) amidotransferase subunit C
MGAQATLDRVQLAHLANLASLSLTGEEAGTLTNEVGAILRYVDELNEVDTSSVEATANVLLEPTAWRPDVVEPSLPRAEALAQAPSAGEQGFAVPTFVNAG